MKLGFKVAALDIDDKKLILAKELGATATFQTKHANFLDELRKGTAGGVDTSICFSGANPAYDTAAGIIKPGGTLMCVGIVGCHLFVGFNSAFSNQGYLE